MSIPSEFLSASLELLQTNVFFADANLKLVYMNQQAKRTLKKIEPEISATFNIKVDKMIGESIDIFHKGREKEIRRMLADETTFPYDTEIKFAGLTLRLKISIVKTDKNEIGGYVVNWSDITDSKRAEHQAELFAQMLDLSPINIMFANEKGILSYVNQNSTKTLKSIEHLMPVKAEQVLGQNLDIFHKNPKIPRDIFTNPKALPHTANIKLGAETLRLMISPIFAKDGSFMGPMATWAVVSDKIKLAEGLNDTVNKLNNSAEDLVNIASNLSSAAEETSAQANTASAASEEISAGVQTVARNMDEMVASIKEITKTTNESSAMSGDALKITKATNEIIGKLGESSKDIGNVIKVISSIAQQTNLLALNATIEAARAGEAGKGFAVVANEVKELAKQTAKATNDITKKIEAIQKDAVSAVGAISNISTAVEKLNGYASNIAAAVEEQAATTNEVTRIVTEAAEGVVQINENISQVSEAANITGKDANKSQDAAKTLGELAKTLGDLVKQIQI